MWERSGQNQQGTGGRDVPLIDATERSSSSTSTQSPLHHEQGTRGVVVVVERGTPPMVDPGGVFAGGVGVNAVGDSNRSSIQSNRSSMGSVSTAASSPEVVRLNGGDGRGYTGRGLVREGDHGTVFSKTSGGREFLRIMAGGGSISDGTRGGESGRGHGRETAHQRTRSI